MDTTPSSAVATIPFPSADVEGCDPVSVPLARALLWLDLGLFPDAVAELRRLCDEGPVEPRTAYYLTLAELRGRRPSQLESAEVGELQDRLRRLVAAAGSGGGLPDQPWIHGALLLWAWIKEDLAARRGIAGCPPSVETLLGIVRESPIDDREELERLLRWLPEGAPRGSVPTFVQRLLRARR